MQKKILLVLVGALALTGCVKEEVACDLSSLTVKSVTLEGDKDGMVSAALSREIFAKGAKSSSDSGAEITGRVTPSRTNGETPERAVVSVKGYPFAGMAKSYSWQPDVAANQIGRSLARDFCRCLEKRRGAQPSSKK